MEDLNATVLFPIHEHAGTRDFHEGPTGLPFVSARTVPAQSDSNPNSFRRTDQYLLHKKSLSRYNYFTIRTEHFAPEST